MYQVQGVYLLYLTTEMAGEMATPADVAISAALSAAAAAFYSAYVAAQGHAVPHLAATATALTATVRRYAGIAVERLAIVQSAGKSYAAAVDTGLDPLRGILDGFVGRVLRGDFTPTDERRVIEGYLDQLWKEVRENLRRPCAMCGCHAPCRVNVIIIITHARAHHTRARTCAHAHARARTRAQSQCALRCFCRLAMRSRVWTQSSRIASSAPSTTPRALKRSGNEWRILRG